MYNSENESCNEFVDKASESVIINDENIPSTSSTVLESSVFNLMFF